MLLKFYVTVCLHVHLGWWSLIVWPETMDSVSILVGLTAGGCWGDFISWKLKGDPPELRKPVGLIVFSQ